MKLKIINRHRFAAFLLILALVVILSIALADADREYSTKTIYIEPGDTLWSLALQHNNTEMEIREYIGEVCRINNIDPEIFPGQAVLFPVE